MMKSQQSIPTSSNEQAYDLHFLTESPAQLNNSKEPPLLLAITKGSLALIKTLLEKGAQPNISNVSGQTPLFIAASEGQVDVVHELLKHGANPLQSTRYGNTPLFIAAVSGHYEIAKVLLQQEEKFYATSNPFFILLKRLNAHAFTLLSQNLYNCDQIEEYRHEKIEFLILLMDILKRHDNKMLSSVLDLERRYQEKIFLQASHTRSLFRAVLRCVYTGNTIAFEETLLQ